MASMPYRRLATPSESSTTAALDVERLRLLWRPWIDLHDEPGGHVIAQNASVLWHHSIRPALDDDLARPWSASFAACGVRSVILGQARVEDALVDDQADGEMGAFKAMCLGSLDGSDALARLQMTSMLGYLTVSEPLLAVSRPDPRDSNPIVQHHAYELAKILSQVDLGLAWIPEVMTTLSVHADEPAIRALSLVYLIGEELRRSPDISSADTLVSSVQSEDATLGAHPRWLELVVRGRILRVLAFYHFRKGDTSEVHAALETAEQCNAELALVAGDHPVLKHLWRENERLILEVSVKSGIGRDPLEVVDAVAKLDVLEPFYPESRFFIGELYARHGDMASAAAHFEMAALGGNPRAPLAAFRAYEMHAATKNQEGVLRALHLVKDLDGAFDMGHYIGKPITAQAEA